MGDQPFFIFLCSSRRKATFKQLLKRRNLLKFDVVSPQYLLIFFIQPLTIRSYKAAAWLVHRVGGKCMFIIAYSPWWLMDIELSIIKEEQYDTNYGGRYLCACVGKES